MTILISQLAAKNHDDMLDMLVTLLPDSQGSTSSWGKAEIRTVPMKVMQIQASNSDATSPEEAAPLTLSLPQVAQKVSSLMLNLSVNSSSLETKMKICFLAEKILRLKDHAEQDLKKCNCIVRWFIAWWHKIPDSTLRELRNRLDSPLWKFNEKDAKEICAKLHVQSESEDPSDKDKSDLNCRTCLMREQQGLPIMAFCSVEQHFDRIRRVAYEQEVVHELYRQFEPPLLYHEKGSYYRLPPCEDKTAIKKD